MSLDEPQPTDLAGAHALIVAQLSAQRSRARAVAADARRLGRLRHRVGDLMPPIEAIRTHVFAAERIHTDDTTVPVLERDPRASFSK